MSGLRPVFAPSSIAFVGVSRNPKSLGRSALRHTRDFGFPGALRVVHPEASEVDGISTVPSIGALDVLPDLAVICTDGDRAIPLLEQAIELGVPGVLVLANGGAVLEPERVRRLLGTGGTRVLGPNSPGYVNVRDRTVPCISSFLSGADLRPGPVAIVSQSGAAASMIAQGLWATGAGFDWLLGAGNEADTGVGDHLAFLSTVGSLRAVGMFVETVRNRDSFRCGLRAAAEAGIRVCALKVGRTDAGQRAALTHSGALTGPVALFRAELEEAGGRLCDDLEDLVACLSVATLPPPTTRSVMVAATSGGFAGLVADAASAAGLAIPEASTGPNPWDTDVAVIEDPEGTARRWLGHLAEPRFGAGLLGLSPIDPDAGRRFSATLAAADPAKPYLVVLPGSGLPEDSATAFRAAARLLRNVHAATAALAWWSDRLPASPDLAARQDGDEHQGKRFLAGLGIATPRGIVADSAEHAAEAAAGLTPPVAVKALRPALLHKARVGGVVLPTGNDAASILAAWSGIASRLHVSTGLPLAGVLVEELAPPGVDLLLACGTQPAYGPYITIGAGGSRVEEDADVVVLPLPATGAEVTARLGRLRIADILAQLAAATGEPGPVPRALLRAVDLLAGVATRHPRLHVEINPLRLTFARAEAVALDCVLTGEIPPDSRDHHQRSDRGDE